MIDLIGSEITVNIEPSDNINVTVGESAQMDVASAVNYIESGKAELQPLVNEAKGYRNEAATSAESAENSAERAETAAELVENAANKDLSNLSVAGEARFAEKADDDAVVHLTGNETITGTKTLDGVLRVTDDQKLIGLSGSRIMVKNGTKSSWLTERYLQFYDNGVVTELSKTSFKLNNSAISATGIVSTAINKSKALITSGGVYTALANKQDALVSGENIKTINGQSVLGDGNLVIASVTSWGNITGTLSAQTDLQTALNAKADTADIPTTTSDLTNDSGFITSSALTPYVLSSSLATVATSGSYDDLSDKPTIPTVPTNVSAFTNDAGYITSSALSGYATQTWVGQQGFITGITSSDVTTALGYTPYNSSNPSGYITSSALTGYATESYVTTATANMQTTGNLVTSISSSSTDTQYPSAKCVYDIVGDIESAINTIRGV